MSGIKKAGMLIILLAFPAFFFLFLKTCGTNHYDLPYYHPLLSDNEVILRGADTVYYQVSGILGVTSEGDTVSSDVLTDRVNVFFLKGQYDEGATAMERYKTRILDKLEHEEKCLFFERYRQGNGGDTGESRRVFVQQPSENYPGWEILLRIDENQNVGRTFSPNSSLILVDGKHHIRGYYDLTDPAEFDRVLAEIKVLLYQMEIAGR